MDRSQFEAAAQQQNDVVATRRADARASHAPCSLVPILAFGGTDYCTAHGVMGECTYGSPEAERVYVFDIGGGVAYSCNACREQALAEPLDEMIGRPEFTAVDPTTLAPGEICEGCEKPLAVVRP